MGNWKLARAFACYWIMEAIGAVSGMVPSKYRRTRTGARIINALCRPFFPYAGYWALRRNPNTRDKIRRIEEDGRP